MFPQEFFSTKIYFNCLGRVSLGPTNSNLKILSLSRIMGNAKLIKFNKLIFIRNQLILSITTKKKQKLPMCNIMKKLMDSKSLKKKRTNH